MELLIISLLSLFMVGRTEPILNPQATYKYMTLPSDRYDLTTNQQLLVKYTMQTSAYETNLYFTQFPSDKVPDFDTYKNYTLIKPEDSQSFPCSLTPPKVTLQPVAKVPNLMDQSTFTSIIAVPAQDIKNNTLSQQSQQVYIGRSYVVTSDYLLKMVDMTFINNTQNQMAADYANLDANVLSISMSDDFVDLSQYLTINDTFFYFPYLLYYQTLKVAYVITPYGALRFKTDSPKPDIVQLNGYTPRKDLNYVHINEQKGYILTANGVDGVDIFAIDDKGDVTLQSTISPNVGAVNPSGFPNDVNIVDVNMDADQSMLFALDKISGLQFFDIFNPKLPVRQNYNLPIPKGKAFDHYLNTFVIVFSIDNAKDVAAEIFFDYNHGSYYVNNIFTHTQQITDVDMQSNFLVLMGQDLNTIMQHSIYNTLHNITDSPDTHFQEYELLQVTRLSLKLQDGSDYQFLVGLGLDTLKVFLYKEMPPQLNCKAIQPLQLGLAIEMKAPICTPLSDYKGPYYQCIILHYFNLNYSGILVDSRNKALALGLGLGLGLTALLLVVIAICFYCRQKRRLQQKESTYNSYQNIEVPEKEMIG